MTSTKYESVTNIRMSYSGLKSNLFFNKVSLRLCASVVIFFFFSVSNVSAQQTNLELAQQYESTGEFDKAVVYYEKQYNVDPFGTFDAYLKCLKTLKEYDKAEKLIKKQSKKGAGSAKYIVDLGSLYELQGDDDKAKKQYELAIKSLHPDVNDVYSIANAFIANQKTDYAIETFLKGRALLDGSFSFGFDLAELYAQKGDMQKTIDEYLNVMMENQQYIANVQAIMQNRIANDMEGKVSDMLRISLLRKIQREPNQLVYNEFLYWLFLQDKDFESALIQAKSLDKKTTNDGSRVFALGDICVSNKDWNAAESCYQYIIEKGKESNRWYVPARIAQVKAMSQRITGGVYTTDDLKKLDDTYKTALNEIGKNAVTAPLISSYAHLKAFYLNNVDEAESLLEETIELPGIQNEFKAECKLELGDILILKGMLWDASLFYSQVDKDFKHEAIGREAKFRNARLSYYLGEFDWAAAQLNVLKQATSQLISNDAMNLALLITDNVGKDSITEPLRIYSRAELLAFQNRDDEALATLDSVLTLFPERDITDDVWYKQATIFLKKKNTTKALQLLQDVVDKYPEDVLADDALFKLGDLYENTLSDKTKAMEVYQKFLEKYPGSLFISDVRKRFRALRGDKIN